MYIRGVSFYTDRCQFYHLNANLVTEGFLSTILVTTDCKVFLVGCMPLQWSRVGLSLNQAS